MKTYEEWRDEQPNQRYGSIALEAFNAGAESKQAEIAKLRAELEFWQRHAPTDEFLKEREELLNKLDEYRAELAEYQNMEPYGVMLPDSDMGVGYDRRIGNVLWFKPTAVRAQTLLFAHPQKDKPE